MNNYAVNSSLQNILFILIRDKDDHPTIFDSTLQDIITKNPRYLTSKEQDETVLHVALRLNRKTMAAKIIQAALNNNLIDFLWEQNNEKQTAFQLALKYTQCLDIITTLLDHARTAHDLISLDSLGRTALHYAFQYSNSTIILKILAKIHDHDLLLAQDKSGYTCIHYALENMNYKLVKNFINPENINSYNSAIPLLHAACSTGNSKAVKFLLKNHANPHLMNYKQETCLNLIGNNWQQSETKQEQYFACAALLLKYGAGIGAALTKNTTTMLSDNYFNKNLLIGSSTFEVALEDALEFYHDQYQANNLAKYPEIVTIKQRCLNLIENYQTKNTTLLKFCHSFFNKYATLQELLIANINQNLDQRWDEQKIKNLPTDLLNQLQLNSPNNPKIKLILEQTTNGAYLEVLKRLVIEAIHTAAITQNKLTRAQTYWLNCMHSPPYSVGSVTTRRSCYDITCPSGMILCVLLFLEVLIFALASSHCKNRQADVWWMWWKCYSEKNRKLIENFLVILTVGNLLLLILLNSTSYASNRLVLFYHNENLLQLINGLYDLDSQLTPTIFDDPELKLLIQQLQDVAYLSGATRIVARVQEKLLALQQNLNQVLDIDPQILKLVDVNESWIEIPSSDNNSDAMENEKLNKWII